MGMIPGLSLGLDLILGSGLGVGLDLVSLHGTDGCGIRVVGSEVGIGAKVERLGVGVVADNAGDCCQGVGCALGRVGVFRRGYAYGRDGREDVGDTCKCMCKCTPSTWMS